MQRKDTKRHRFGDENINAKDYRKSRRQTCESIGTRTPTIKAASILKHCLPHSFFERNTVEVAQDLLGKYIVRKVDSQWLCARIVETEAYLEKGDPAAHCSRGPTPRAKIMFGPAGFIYVYFIYGNYFLLNFVTEKEGSAGAVLVRAVEPIDGIQKMVDLRNFDKKNLIHLTNGPAKLVLALGIDGSLNGKPLGLPHLAVCDGLKVDDSQIVATTRIGISKGEQLPFRFYEKMNPYVSISVD